MFKGLKKVVRHYGVISSYNPKLPLMVSIGISQSCFSQNIAIEFLFQGVPLLFSSDIVSMEQNE